MKVLMIGWELPPLISGGLGVACDGLLRALRRQGAEVTFVVPVVADIPGEAGHAVGALGTVRPGGLVQASPEAPAAWKYSLPFFCGAYVYRQVLEQVDPFNVAVLELARGLSFDVVHAHDWMTFPAAAATAAAAGKPLVVHVHSIEQDRSPHGPDPRLCRIEAAGLAAADAVIAVSEGTRRRVIDAYRVCPDKVHVVYNGIEGEAAPVRPARRTAQPGAVLFVGRLTAQKGPQYFLQAAARVLVEAPETRFLMVGEGDMREELEETARRLGIDRSVVFAGFLSPLDLQRAYRRSSVCVMTSVSEPFGLVALEAMKMGVPVIAPCHAGVGEVVHSYIAVDHSNTEQIAAAVLDLLAEGSPLARRLSREARQEVRKLTWTRAAARTMALYRRLGVPAVDVARAPVAPPRDPDGGTPPRQGCRPARSSPAPSSQR